MTDNKVGIVLLNWNNWEDTLTCLDSLFRLQYPSYLIIVVDNCSSNDSLDHLRPVKDIHLIASNTNLGFSGGCNLGIAYALNHGCDFVWLLNNDTEVDPNSLQSLVLKSKDTGVGLVGSLLYYWHDHSIQAIGGGYLNRLKVSCKHIRDIDNIDKLEYLTAASLLIPREVVETIGMWDDRFFVYWEDVDYSFRVKKYGYKLAVALDSIVLHKESVSRASLSERLIEYQTRGLVLFFRKQNEHLIILWGCFLRFIKFLVLLDFKRLRALLRGIRQGFDYRFN